MCFLFFLMIRRGVLYVFVIQLYAECMINLLFWRTLDTDCRYRRGPRFIFKRPPSRPSFLLSLPVCAPSTCFIARGSTGVTMELCQNTNTVLAEMRTFLSIRVVFVPQRYHHMHTLHKQGCFKWSSLCLRLTSRRIGRITVVGIVHAFCLEFDRT